MKEFFPKCGCPKNNFPNPLSPKKKKKEKISAGGGEVRLVIVSTYSIGRGGSLGEESNKCPIC